MHVAGCDALRQAREPATQAPAGLTNHRWDGGHGKKGMHAPGDELLLDPESYRSVGREGQVIDFTAELYTGQWSFGGKLS
jgi:hypothetical protein